MTNEELKALKADIVTGVSDTLTEKVTDKVAEKMGPELKAMHDELSATADAVQKMREGAFGRVDAQDKKEMDRYVANYFQTEILKLDGVQKAWDSNTSGAASEMIPAELNTRFLVALDTYNKLRQNVTVYPSDKGTLFAGATAATNVTVMGTRGTPSTESAPTFTPVTYSTRGRQVWCAVDEKVVRESPLKVLDIMMGILAKGIAAAEYADFITGDGNGDWTGLAASGITTSTPAAHSTIATLDATETVAPYWALGSAYRQGPPINKTFWMCSASYSQQLAALNAAAKEWFKFGVGENTYLGVPIWEHATVASSGALAPAAYIGDVSEYYIFDKLGTMLRTATGGKTLTLGHQIIVEAYNETDGKLPLAAAFKSLTLHA